MILFFALSAAFGVLFAGSIFDPGVDLGQHCFRRGVFVFFDFGDAGLELSLLPGEDL